MPEINYGAQATRHRWEKEVEDADHVVTIGNESRLGLPKQATRVSSFSSLQARDPITFYA